MNKPTPEQIKRFWEKCGIKFNTCKLPQSGCLDLNNLFKWAVPQGLIEDGMDISFRSPDINRDFPKPYWVCQLHAFNYGKGFSVRAEGDSPALALFWAIYKVIKND